ncbi:Hypothetical predicted protein [Podarcis lilfordi]|uniref:Uncharacterized protein n=1 Tax=Podarcis lilfordi TaxID=74358 RepID=A0AA35NYF2_9SAUR|nr:Hypothetical predicted protein [Podarcis lilfordi]
MRDASCTSLLPWRGSLSPRDALCDLSEFCNKAGEKQRHLLPLLHLLDANIRKRSSNVWCEARLSSI